MMRLFHLFFIFGFCFKLDGQTASVEVNPNPFVTRALLQYTVPAADTITIDVFNLLGQTVLTIISNSIMSAGVYQDSIRLDSFPDGRYLLRMSNRQKILKVMPIFKIFSVTAVTEHNQHNYFSVGPNPVKDKLFVACSNCSFGVRLNILNSMGQLTYHNNNLGKDEVIDCKNFAPGLYFFMFTHEQFSQVLRVIKE